MGIPYSGARQEPLTPRVHNCMVCAQGNGAMSHSTGSENLSLASSTETSLNIVLTRDTSSDIVGAIKSPSYYMCT